MAGSPSAVVGVHIPVTELILIECEAMKASGKMDHDICGNWSPISSWALMKEASLEWTRMMGRAAPDRADTPAPLSWKETVWSGLLVAVHGSGRGNGRNDIDKSAKKKLFRKACFGYDEGWRTGSSHKAKGQEERTLKRMPCGACVSAVQRCCG